MISIIIPSLLALITYIVHSHPAQDNTSMNTPPYLQSNIHYENNSKPHYLYLSSSQPFPELSLIPHPHISHISYNQASSTTSQPSIEEVENVTADVSIFNSILDLCLEGKETNILTNRLNTNQLAVVSNLCKQSARG